jgi:hypothetical protein
MVRCLAVAMTLAAMVIAAPGAVGPGQFGGTFIGAIVCEDGIVIASDSRSTFEDATHKPIGYVDGMTKIFVHRGAAFAVSGLTSVNDELFPSFVRRNQFLLERPVNEILFGVSLWLPFQNSTNVLLISAGYSDGKPTICAKGPNNPQVCRHAGYVTNKDSDSLNRWWAQNRGVAPKTRDAANALRRAILERAGRDRGVGGPIAILELPKNSAPVWIEKSGQDDRWTKVCDLANDYRKGRAGIAFVNSREELDRYLVSICPVLR